MRDETDYNMEAYDWQVPLSELVGKTIVRLEQVNDWSELRFFCSDGTVYALFHIRECCETVYLEDVNGELSWLLDTPILMADEAEEETGTEEEYGTRYRWTFYRFATRKGYVDLRFLGLSNGYYSEKMDFIRIPEKAVTKQGWIRGEDRECGEEESTHREADRIRWIREEDPECGEREAEERAENTFLCLCSSRLNELKILAPKWMREYGFWMEYTIDVEDITGEREFCWDILKCELWEWMDQILFPGESKSLIRDGKKREEFLSRVRSCSFRLDILKEEEWG